MRRVNRLLNWVGLAFFSFLVVLVFLDAGVFAGMDNLTRGVLLLFYIGMAFIFLAQIAREVQDEEREEYEREADTKIPSENGTEPFGKRDTTAYMIEKGRTNRW